MPWATPSPERWGGARGGGPSGLAKRIRPEEVVRWLTGISTSFGGVSPHPASRADDSRRQLVNLGPGRLPVLEVEVVDLDEGRLPLGNILLGVDGVPRAGVDAGTAVDALVGVDVEHPARPHSGCSRPGRPRHMTCPSRGIVPRRPDGKRSPGAPPRHRRVLLHLVARPSTPVPARGSSRVAGAARPIGLARTGTPRGATRAGQGAPSRHSRLPVPLDLLERSPSRVARQCY